MKNSLHLLKNFKNDEKGVFSLILAIAFVGLIIAILAFSVDLNRAQTSYADTQNSTDTAALSVAEWVLREKIDKIGQVANPLAYEPSDTEIEEYAKDILLANFARDQGSATFFDDESFVAELSKENAGPDKIRYTVTVSACAFLDSPLAAAAEYDPEQRVCTSSKAAFDLGVLENTEVAFALDFTESMFWDGVAQSCPPGFNSDCPRLEETKAQNLVTTMNYVFDTYYPETVDSNAYSSIIPYTGFANIYPYNKDFLGSSSDNFNFLQDNSFNSYITMNHYNLEGDSFRDYQILSQFTPYYIRPSDEIYAGVGSRDLFLTEDYSYVLDRVPVIRDAGEFQNIANQGGSFSTRPQESFKVHIVDNLGEEIVFDASKSDFKQSANPSEAYRFGECYNGMIAAAADQRIERRERFDEGVIESSDWIKDNRHDGRYVELHESYPIQPLTNSTVVLRQVVDRFVSDKFLYGSNEEIFEPIRMDRQTSRLNRGADVSAKIKTSSVHGLLWSWYSLNNDWNNRWNRKSLHESYCDEVGGLGCTGSGTISQSSRQNLPSEENFKHIILVSDGNDIDGLEAGSGKIDATEGVGLGYYNSCDAYVPIERLSVDQYSELCTAIKEQGIQIHMILFDYTPTQDSKPLLADFGRNRFQECASPGSYYENVKIDSLKDVMDGIFLGILTDLTPVRLVK